MGNKIKFLNKKEYNIYHRGVQSGSRIKGGGKTLYELFRYDRLRKEHNKLVKEKINKWKEIFIQMLKEDRNICKCFLNAGFKCRFCKKIDKLAKEDLI